MIILDQQRLAGCGNLPRHALSQLHRQAFREFYTSGDGKFQEFAPLIIQINKCAWNMQGLADRIHDPRQDQLRIPFPG